jgi:penicillin-binding protein 1B
MTALRARLARLRGRVRPVGPLAAVALAGAGLLVLAAVTLATYTAVELARFARSEAVRRTVVYAAGQMLAPGVSVRAVDLAGTLARLKYRETSGPPGAPGQFRRTAAAWDIYARGLEDDLGRTPALVRLELRGDRIARVLRDRKPVDVLRLEPEVLPGGGDRGEDYRPVRLAEVPPALRQAVLAAEDHRFFEHGGVDLRGLLRAAWVNVRRGRVSQGGSTITQQLVKNRLLGSRRTLGRKLREAWLAAVLEWRYSKAEILESYLNEAYLGQRGSLAIRGVGAAARAYFGKEVHQLTLGEAALLAGMIRAPNSYSPTLNPERARQRRDVVLARMRELGQISEAQYAAARAEPVRVQARPAPGRWAPYFADYVQLELEEQVGDRDDEAAGARILTTLDLTLQRFAEAAVARGLERLEARWPRLRRADPAHRLQAVLVALHPSTGHVLALVGGRDYQSSQFNRALHARRQPGSAFKPFVYLAALRARPDGPAFTAATLVDDEPVTLTVNGQPWTPRNYDDVYAGRVSVRRALELSLNAATVRIAQEVGLPEVIEAARALGLTSPLRPVPAVALGAFEVTPLELARAYLPLANGGRRLEALTSVRAVYDPQGNALAVAEPESRPVISAAEAYLVTSLLQGVLNAGTGVAARSLGVTGPLAGKTGTTNDGRDAWFVGYTPHLLALVWVGFDGGEAHGLSAAEAALPIWADFMRQALDAYPAPPIEVPAGVSVVEIDPTNGRRATRFCPVVIQEVFLEGSEPRPCEEHGWIADQVIDWWRRLRDWFRR